MKVNQATHPVGMMCRLLQVSRSGYYAWLDRPMCARKRADLALTGKIAAIHRFSRETYGSPMIHAELADAQGIHVGRKRVARLMRAAGLRGATLRKFVVTTQRADQSSEVTTWSSGAFTLRGRIGCGWRMRPIFRRGADFCTW